MKYQINQENYHRFEIEEINKLEPRSYFIPYTDKKILSEKTALDEMLEKEEIDTVSIVAPTFEHYSITCKCLKKGINVLCEKPMANSVEECKRMIAAAERNNKKLAIGHVQRYMESISLVKEI